MAKVDKYEMPDDLYYHKEHMWARVEDDTVTVGLNDFTQQLAGDISYIELPDEGDEFEQDELIGSVETGKWVGKFYAPVSGEITEVNEDVDDDPTAVNEDPYGKGWLFKMKMSDPSELDNLMRGDAAIEWLKGEIEKHAK